MSFFSKKQELSQSLLTQLERIANSLEQGTQAIAGDKHQEINAHLSKIAQVIETVPPSEVNSEFLLQLNKIVNVLERNCQGMPDEAKKDLLAQLNRIANALEQSLPPKTLLSELDKSKAAYALNLCLVSISQIIDYSDLYILEQEYDGILNNLNLEHMPKDDALLDILRQILDTITFFRIQEGEKEFIEKKYQHKIKNAIWSAVPNCGVVLACAEPKAMLVSLVSQVGTGYMNYRKTKAEAKQDKEDAEWELHKAAIEQFNGLRRELFTAAWKLADKYQFKDKLRLTESQITQYNRILMEANLNRRFVLLCNIEENFKAFPPFWYFKGHTALLLATQGFRPDAMLKEARNSFETYFAINNEQSTLLRTDPICATCALEYVTLLGKNEISEKLISIKRAIESAGNHFDILQMCAMAYIDLAELDHAAKILKHLVCSGYNETVNAQLLSLIYIKNHLSCLGQSDCKAEYELLPELISAGAKADVRLLPWPTKNIATSNGQYAEFVSTCKESLLETYSNFMVNYYSQKADECRLAIMSECDKTEQAFVQFMKKMQAEIATFPGTGLETHESFIHLLAGKQDDLKKLSKSGFSTKRFENAFGDLFLTIAHNISSSNLTTMEKISELENLLAKTTSDYIAKTSSQSSEETIQAFLMLDDSTSDSFKTVKELVSKQKNSLLKPDAKRTKLLIAGELEYYEYIKRHLLDEKDVVAVINDQSVNDCDLIFTETGLLIHEGRSLAATGVKFAFFGVYELLNEGLRLMIKHTVPYANIEYKEDRITKPGYKNKNVNMTALFSLIDEIKQGMEGSIEYKIVAAINGRDN